MFPLADGRGKVLGFGARQMGEGRGPKYLNTSENDIYHKGRQLFGIDVARKEAMRTARFVVVEGYTDVLALHQAGIREAVAIMGTALTQEQLAELAKVATATVGGSSTSPSTRIEPDATPCCVPPGWRRIEASICASSRCLRARTRRSS